MCRIKIAWIATIGIAVIAVIVAIVASSGKSPISIGDWGDYVGGFAATITLIWLVVGYYQSQEEILKTKSDLLEQAELTREAVGALTRIASSSQVHAAKALKEAEPKLVHLSSTPIAAGTQKYEIRSTSEKGYIALRNEGNAIEIRSIESLCDDFVVEQLTLGLVSKGREFKVKVKCKKEIRKAGELRLRFQVDDQFVRHFTLELYADKFDSTDTKIQILRMN